MGEVGMLVLGAVLLLLGTDSLAKGVAAALARRQSAGFAYGLWAAALMALVPAALLAGIASHLGAHDLALGGLVGGAIAQLGLVLGLAAVVRALRVRVRAISWIAPMLIGAVILLGALAFDGTLSPVDGGLLVVAFVLCALVIARAARREREAARALFDGGARTLAPALVGLRIVLGAALAGYGAWLLVHAGIGIAAAAHWNSLIIGLVVLGALGALASAPGALATARRGHGDFAVAQALLGALGNVLLLLGVLALGHALELPPSLLRFELLALFALAVAIHPMMLSDGELSRREGLALVVTYLLFVIVEWWLVVG